VVVAVASMVASAAKMVERNGHTINRDAIIIPGILPITIIATMEVAVGRTAMEMEAIVAVVVV
jgi:hypothetical protein